MGKGSKRRPTLINKEIADLNWDIAFCKEEERKKEMQDRREELQRELVESEALYTHTSGLEFYGGNGLR